MYDANLVSSNIFDTIMKLKFRRSVVEILATAETLPKAIQCAELLIMENKVLRAQIGGLQSEGARLQEERSWVGERVSELISKCAAYEIENTSVHTQVRSLHTQVSELVIKCTAYKVKNAHLHTQACYAQENHRHLPSTTNVSCKSVAVQTEGILTVTREAGAQAGRSNDTHWTQSSKGVQAEVVHFESEPETHVDRSSNPSSQSPPSVDTSQDEGALTEEILVVSGK
ncbi:hypothetical protein IMY05_C4626000300 [Salix suchowensis]|nr:hypothetical protein IMY05_C4626000300 [Salix suchowensis]